MAIAARREWPVKAEDENELVELARRGDRDAAERLLLRHELLVFRLVRNLLPRGEDVESAVQETFVRALRGLPRFGGSATFSSWLAAIAVNLCRDRLRRHRLVPFVPLEKGSDDDEPGPLDVLPAATPDPERQAMARQAVGRVRRELDRLPGRQREVFALRFFAGLDLEGIAAALGVDIGTVKTHLHRGVQRVRRVAEEALP
jgi:RNA polymerase sigma-70 factor (ECF subfamily)